MARSTRGVCFPAAVFLSFLGSSAPAQFNPNGFIRTRGWNLLLPLQQQPGCSGGGTESMRRNWVSPHDIGREDPKAGTSWPDVEFTPDGASGFAPIFPDLRWFTNAYLEAEFGLAPGSAPDGEGINLEAVVNFVNSTVVPGVPGMASLPSDNILALATTYVENLTGSPLDVEVCTASDDSVQVWINNIVVTNVSACRGIIEDCYERRPGVLPPGVSKIAALVWEGSGDWQLRLGIHVGGQRITDADPRISFLGPGDPGTVGQVQYDAVRTLGADVGCEGRTAVSRPV